MRFELADSKGYEGFDLFVLMSLNFLIPLDLRFNLKKLSVYKYTKDGAFIHSVEFMKDPVVGMQIIIENHDGKKQQMFALVKGERTLLSSLGGWKIQRSSIFSDIQSVENVFLVDYLSDD